MPKNCNGWPRAIGPDALYAPYVQTEIQIIAFGVVVQTECNGLNFFCFDDSVECEIYSPVQVRTVCSCCRSASWGEC